ncbi:hypothetical protein [Streptomyces aculeolatus]|uniref:hypothetical protein n=1 Tax=Streptomyces aculeolatus TaxID=270689 RepID=UPI001CED59E5|nr:hypothetical protein [Streptomyces aculeolatus]
MRRLSGLAATGLVLACPVWVWWVVGQQDANGDDLDYCIRPPELASGLEPVLGVSAFLVAVVCAGVLVVASWLAWFD